MKYFATALSLTLCGLRFRISIDLEDDEPAARAPQAHHVYSAPAREARSQPSVRF